MTAPASDPSQPSQAATRTAQLHGNSPYRSLEDQLSTSGNESSTPVLTAEWFAEREQLWAEHADRILKLLGQYEDEHPKGAPCLLDAQVHDHDTCPDCGQREATAYAKGHRDAAVRLLRVYSNPSRAQS